MDIQKVSFTNKQLVSKLQAKVSIRWGFYDPQGQLVDLQACLFHIAVRLEPNATACRSVAQEIWRSGLLARRPH